ncbi:MAG TPA: tetratricopeptide repeat protein [Phycisphaerae bacterium]|nr:tetratricopeptide repeat protein [Phycisphaerae bacterium]
MKAMLTGACFALLLAGTQAALAQASSPLDDRAAAVGTSDPAALAALGHLYIEALRLDEARQAYRAAQKIQKKFGEAEFGLARIEMAKGKLEKSKNACRGVARRFKAESTGEVCSGWVWLTFDRAARAVDEFNKALDKGDVARGQTGLGEAYRRQVNWSEAIAAYEKAIAAGAGHIALVGRGLAEEGSGNRAAAVATLEKAVAAEPASCEARYHHGRLLGQGPRAVEQILTALTIRPGWADALQTLGEILLAGGDFPGAEQAFTDTLAAEPTRGTAQLGLGQALFGQGKIPAAKEHLSKAIEMVPNLVDAYLLLADIEYAGGNPDAALEALDKARTMAPGVVKVYLRTGETYFRLGRHTSANSYLKQALAMQADLSMAHLILGDIACERRLYEEGLKHYAGALAGDMVGIVAADVAKRQAVCKPKK